MIYVGENELIYINCNMEAFPMPKYSYFQRICEINSFITLLYPLVLSRFCLLNGGLKVASKWLKGVGLKVVVHLVAVEGSNARKIVLFLTP